MRWRIAWQALVAGGSVFCAFDVFQPSPTMLTRIAAAVLFVALGTIWLVAIVRVEQAPGPDLSFLDRCPRCKQLFSDRGAAVECDAPNHHNLLGVR